MYNKSRYNCVNKISIRGPNDTPSVKTTTNIICTNPHISHIICTLTTAIYCYTDFVLMFKTVARHLAYTGLRDHQLPSALNTLFVLFGRRV